MSRSIGVSGGLLVAACIVSFVALNRWFPAPLTFEAQVQTTSATRLRLFYAGAEALNDRSAITVTVDSRSEPTTVRFPIRASEVRALRLSAIDNASRVQISQSAVSRSLGSSRRFRQQDIALESNATFATEHGESVALLDRAAGSEAAVGFRFTEPLVASVWWKLLRWTVVALLLASAIGFLWLPRPETVHTEPARWAVVALLTFVFFAATLMKLNGSSTGLWRLFADGESPDASIIAGTAREIRSDEWTVHTPWLFSQLTSGPALALSNPGVGDRPSTLLTNLPVHHWTTIFRPQMWGFFCLPVEQAFALYWNFKWFALVLGAFLFLERLSGGKTLLAAAGALFLLGSSYVQWWFSSPTFLPEMLAMMFFALWSIGLMLRARSRATVVASAVVCLFSVLQFVFCCYPRFQIPLVYVSALLIGCSGVYRPVSDDRAFRLATVGLTFGASAVLLAIWYVEVAPLIHAISQLAYPGRIVSTGGDVGWAQLFAPFLEGSMTEQNYPAAAMNVCEAAGFLFLAPLLAVLALRDAVLRRVDGLLLGCTLGAVVLVAFMVIGIPTWLARISGWSHVYGARALLPLGVVTAVGLWRYLSRAGAPVVVDRRVEIAALAGVGIALGLFLWRVNVSLQYFVDFPTVVAAAVFFALVVVCIWWRRVTASCALLVVPLLCSHGLANPVSIGLPGLTHSALRATISELHNARPSARWLVRSRSARGPMIAQLIKTTGARTLGGMSITPDSEMLAVLDPAGEFSHITHRNAIVAFAPSVESKPRMELTFINAYTVHLPRSGELFDAVGVAYVIDVDLPDAEPPPAGFVLVGGANGCRIFARPAPH